MKKTKIEVKYIDIKKISNEIFLENIKNINEKSIKKINNFKNENDKKLQLASEILKSLNKNDFFSISHSGDYCCIVFHEQEIGIDIQKKEKKIKWNKIAKRGFQDCVIENENSFYNFWTVKEAAIKCSGYEKIILVSDIKILENTVFADKKQFHFCNFSFQKQYIGAVCCSGEIETISFEEIIVFNKK